MSGLAVYGIAYSHSILITLRYLFILFIFILFIFYLLFIILFYLLYNVSIINGLLSILYPFVHTHIFYLNLNFVIYDVWL